MLLLIPSALLIINNNNDNSSVSDGWRYMVLKRQYWSTTSHSASSRLNTPFLVNTQQISMTFLCYCNPIYSLAFLSLISSASASCFIVRNDHSPKLREMLRYQMLDDAASSFQDSLKALEADIQHANVLAASIPRGKGKACLQMKLVYNQLAPIFMCLFRWMDYSCSCLLSSHLNLFHVIVYKVHTNEKPNIYSCGRKATIREFYSVILPSLQRLRGDLVDADITQEEDHSIQMVLNRSDEGKRKPSDLDSERENECGICLESCTKIVLPNCCHAMCINCYNDWHTRSESCPFCRGSLKRVYSGDLWVLTCSSDVIDVQTIYREDMLRLYLFVNSLPEYIPDALFFMYYEYLF